VVDWLVAVNLGRAAGVSSAHRFVPVVLHDVAGDVVTVDRAGAARSRGRGMLGDVVRELLDGRGMVHGDLPLDRAPRGGETCRTARGRRVL
jgi:hypothetical protein